jgi:hypothetical protein
MPELPAFVNRYCPPAGSGGSQTPEWNKPNNLAEWMHRSASSTAGSVV